MVYATDDSKWKAYQFLDPFAAGSFYVCNKSSRVFCNPNCDAYPITELRLEIQFVDTPGKARALGYAPCKSCNPMLEPSVDVTLLLAAVQEINAQIGFVPPLLDDDEDKVTETIRGNMMGLDSAAPAKTVAAKSALYSVSKNDSEHYRLIDLACRHLALAAAISIFHPSKTNEEETKSLKKKGTKKRRGGVLGFKELATKSRLSAWHFHRVFKSIIGLTPKTYGDLCWDVLERKKNEMDANQNPGKKHVRNRSLAESVSDISRDIVAKVNVASPVSRTSLSRSTTPTPLGIKKEPYYDMGDACLTPPQTAQLVMPATPASGQKRCHENDDIMAMHKRHSAGAMTSPDMSPFTDLRGADFADSRFGQAMRATSAPNLAANLAPKSSMDFGASAAPASLFQHLRNFDFSGHGDHTSSFSATDPVFAPALTIPEDYCTVTMLGEISPNMDNISPTTVDNILPLNGSTMISPQMLANDPVLIYDFQGSAPFPVPDYAANYGDFYPSLDMFPDLFKTKNEYPTDYSLSDPFLSGLAPEVLTGMDF